MDLLLLVFLLFVALLVIIGIFGKSPVTISSHWQHYYDGITLSADDFYQKVRDGFKQRKIELSITNEYFLESHIFSHKRLYMRINIAEYVFYIFCGRFGTGTFVSWWLCVKDERMINKIPILNKLAGKDRKNKTFYQLDTEGMFRSAIHATVAGVADSLTEASGIRLSELDRQFMRGALDAKVSKQ